MKAADQYPGRMISTRKSRTEKINGASLLGNNNNY